MAVTILSNKANTSAVIHIAVANSTLTIAGNSTVSNVAIGNEVLTGATIRKAAWGTDAGSIQILRGSNLVATCTGSHAIDYASMNMPLTKDSTATLVVNFVGSSNGYIVFEVAKQGTTV